MDDTLLNCTGADRNQLTKELKMLDLTRIPRDELQDVRERFGYARDDSEFDATLACLSPHAFVQAWLESKQFDAILCVAQMLLVLLNEADDHYGPNANLGVYTTDWWHDRDAHYMLVGGRIRKVHGSEVPPASAHGVRCADRDGGR